MKKWFFLLIAAAFLLFGQAAWASAAAPKATDPVPRMILDGMEVSAAVPPRLIDNWVLVPIRTVAENLGYKVGWDHVKKQVTVEEGSTQILMTLGEKTALVNGRAVSMQTPPVLYEDSTMIPLRFVSESFGVQILWDNKDKAVYLYTDHSAKTEVSGSPSDGSKNTAQPNGGADAGAAPDSGAGGSSGQGDAGNSATGSKDAGEGKAVGTSSQTGSGTDSGASAGGGWDNHEEGGSEDEGSGGLPDSAAEPAKLSQIRYEPNYLVLTYNGSLKPVTHYLSGPDRLVVDLVNAEFADEFSAGFASGLVADYKPKLTEAPPSGQIAEMPVNGEANVTGIRFSKFADNPRTVRVVVDLSRFTPHELIHDEERGVVVLRLMPEYVKDKYIVVLDAGHGGSDPGAKSLSGHWEKDFNLSVVKKVQEILSKESKINLVLTREGDTYPTLDDRINLANALNADLFISVHGNSNKKSDINGTETYYFRPESQALAELLHKNATAATGFKDNGIRTAEFKVVKYTVMPAALLEVGYLSNADNERKMMDEKFQQRVAEAIAATIKQYFKLS